MKMYFRTQDLKLLEALDERQLYMLNRILNSYVSIMKYSSSMDKEIICEVVALAETAAKEVACRKRWSPMPSNGSYNTSGITYDISEYRKWLIANKYGVSQCDLIEATSDFGFSFWEDLSSLLMRA